MTNTAAVPVASRLAGLNALAEDDPQAAQDAAWAWVQRLGKELPGAAAELELAELFGAGAPADVDGQTDGLLVGWVTAPADLDRDGRRVLLTARGVSGRVMPWLGPETGNPFPINRIRDEAVQIVPGTYLGAKIWHQTEGYRRLAYWAAKAPVSEARVEGAL
jgi:hypothetical protein